MAHRFLPGRCSKHVGMLAKISFSMCFTHAIPRVNLLAISIELAISIYFDCMPAILITILIISIYFELFWSIFIISMYFNQFDLFRSISIMASKLPKHFNRTTAILICFVPPNFHAKHLREWSQHHNHHIVALIYPPTPWLLWFTEGFIQNCTCLHQPICSYRKEVSKVLSAD